MWGSRKGGGVDSSLKGARGRKGGDGNLGQGGKGLTREKEWDEVARVRGVRTRILVSEGELGAKPGRKQVGSGQTKK